MDHDAPFRLIPGDQWRVVALDTLAALYVRPSAQTHIIASPVPELLAVMGSEQWTIARLRRALAAQYALDDADALVARIVDLRAMGMIADD